MRYAKHDRKVGFASDHLAEFRRFCQQFIGRKTEPYRDHISEFEARARTGQLVDLGDGCYQVRKS